MCLLRPARTRTLICFLCTYINFLCPQFPPPTSWPRLPRPVSMSDNELGGVHTPVSSGASSASTTTGSTAGTTPKLKLTFKLAEIRAASPVPSSITGNAAITNFAGEGESGNRFEVAAGTGATVKKPRRQARKDSTSLAAAPPPPSSSSSFVTPYKKARREAASTEGTAVSQPPSGETTPSPSTNAASASLGGASSRVQFPEQITFVREMRKLRARRWRRESTAVSLLGGRSLTLPCWARDRPTASSYGGGTSGSPKTARTGEDASTFAPTFVCTWEGCHKIFDAKDKWRRHLNLHRRKERKAAVEGRKASPDGTDSTSYRTSTGSGNLQLKLNLGSLLRKASSAISVADGVAESPVPSSGAPDDVDIS